MNNELYHFNHKHDKLGRFTFSRGGHVSARSSAKAQKKDRDRKISDEYDKTINDIEKKYSKGQTLSNEDYKRQVKAENKANNAWKESKQQYKDDVKAAKKRRKELDKFTKALRKSPYASQLTSMAAVSQLRNKEHVQTFATYANAGQMYMKSTFKANYENNSIDMYLLDSKDPIMRVRMQNGSKFTYDFVNSEDKKRYNRNIEYLR